MLYRELIEYRVLISFDSLTQAMAAEKVFKKFDCPYALIPTPKSMRSGCNNAICFPLQRKDIIEDLLDAGVVIMGAYEATENGFTSLSW
ncbi:MAG: DUF3343 domain-containing protein [Desulfosporosinus sp.]|nr:DUF3343 domain-containing protein [Desulfosporosinus sp.]